MSLAQQREVHALLEALHTTKKQDSAWLNQVSEGDSSVVHTFEKGNTEDLVISNPNELFEYKSLPDFKDRHLQRYFSGFSHPYTSSTVCSAARQTKEGIRSQNCKSETRCSVGSYVDANLEVTSPSGDYVSKKVLPAEDRDCLEALASKQRSQNMLNDDQLQSSSSEMAILAPTGPCRSALAVGHAQYRLTNPNDSVLDAHALVESGGIKKNKKRSRPSRKPPTTILEADSANFRFMVQKLTGIPSSPLFSRQNVPDSSSDLSAFQSVRQFLISKSSAGGIYGNSQSQSEHPSKNLFFERDESVPFGGKPTVGISDSSIMKDLCMGRSSHHSHSSSLLSSSPLLACSTAPEKTCIRKSKD